MGVRINHAAHANIIAGARYLAMLRDRLPARIAEPDSTWFALAAYNQGPGHLEDARVLAQKLGMNPDVWVDVRRALPLLADPAYYEELPHGYARGGEAMALTENVRAFYKILVQIAPPMRELSQPGAPYLTDEAPSPTDDDISKEPVRQDEVLLPDPILI
jgi:membrane-bound lytic murein transglycosylase MltF